MDLMTRARCDLEHSVCQMDWSLSRSRSCSGQSRETGRAGARGKSPDRRATRPRLQQRRGCNKKLKETEVGKRVCSGESRCKRFEARIEESARQRERASKSAGGQREQEAEAHSCARHACFSCQGQALGSGSTCEIRSGETTSQATQ